LATGQLIRSWLGLGGTPVFLYHGLTLSSIPECPWHERKYWVSAAQFHDHLACIRREGHQVVQLREFWNSADGSERQYLPVALTFDDGNCSDYEIAFPLLLEAGKRAEFFVNTATVGKKRFLSWQQMSEMQQAGMSFQSHSHDHVDLSRLALRETERQLRLSKQILEARLGREVEFVSVPYGDLSTEVVKVAMQVGYRAVCTSRSWPAQPGSRLVNRAVVYSDTSPRAYEGLLVGRPTSYAIRTARGAILFLPKRILLHFLRPHAVAAVLEDLS
jgi:peptidoglycan/xylan/chitin deacetylase (PgdA/CDA1 family)